jgi:hypothetical protein
MSLNIAIFSNNDSLRSLLSRHNVISANVSLYKDIDGYSKSDDIVIVDADYLPDYGSFFDGAKSIILSSSPATAKYHIQKPYRFVNLVSLLGELVNDSAISNNIDIGRFKFNYMQKLLFNDSHKISLTEKEAEIINVLAGIAPNSFDKKELLRRVWRYSEEIDTNTLETHMYRLRKKIGDDEFIVTEKDGYKIKML